MQRFTPRQEREIARDLANARFGDLTKLAKKYQITRAALSYRRIKMKLPPFADADRIAARRRARQAPRFVVPRKEGVAQLADRLWSHKDEIKLRVFEKRQIRERKRLVARAKKGNTKAIQKLFQDFGVTIATYAELEAELPHKPERDEGALPLIP